MMKIIRNWVSEYLANEEMLALLIIMIAVVLSFVYIPSVMAPLLVSIVLTFLMQGAVTHLEKWRVPRIMAVSLLVMLLILSVLLMCVIFLPVLWDQLERFISELPNMINHIEAQLSILPDRYPQWITHDQLADFNAAIQNELAGWGKGVVSFSFSKISNLFSWVLYAFLVPMLVFFFLKDKELILGWLSTFLPKKRPILKSLSDEMDQQITNYIRGKMIEIFVVGVICFIFLSFLNMKYGILLSVLTGISVLVPFVGAAVIGIVVVVLGLIQFGLTQDFLYLFFGYGLLQVLDGNVLVPLLFSEVVNLHPVAIILAVFLFGALWGIWGVFFSIPLAIFIKALLSIRNKSL
jgi:putative permease